MGIVSEAEARKRLSRRQQQLPRRKGSEIQEHRHPYQVQQEEVVPKLLCATLLNAFSFFV